MLAAALRIAEALERIATTLESLDEPQTYDVQTDRQGRVVQIREV